MRVAPHDDDLDHGRLAALAIHQPAVQVVYVLLDELHINRVALLLPSFFQREEDGRAELVRAQDLLHALHQVVPVLGVAEAGLDLVDLGVGAAHEGLDEQLAPGPAGLVVAVGPVGLGLPATQGGCVARLAEGAGADLELDVLGHADAHAVIPDLLPVLGAQGERLVVREVGEDPDQGLGVDVPVVFDCRLDG